MYSLTGYEGGEGEVGPLQSLPISSCGANAQVSRSSVLNAESKLGLLNLKLPLYFNKNIIYLNLEFLTQICNDHNQCPCTLPVPSFHLSNAVKLCFALDVLGWCYMFIWSIYCR